jgi:hypothetical protein
MPLSGGGSTPSLGSVVRDHLAEDVKADLTRAQTSVQQGEKGAANGVAGLDGNGRVPSTQLPPGAGGVKPYQRYTASRTLAAADLAAESISMDATTEQQVIVPEESATWAPTSGSVVHVIREGTGGVLFATSGTTPGAVTVDPAEESFYVTNATTATSYPVPMPPGLEDGDFVLVVIPVAQNSTGFTFTTVPAGFVELARPGVSGASMNIFYVANVAAALSGTTQTFAHNGSGSASAIGVHAFSDVDPTNPIAAFLAPSASSGTTPSFQTEEPNVFEVALKCAFTATTITGAVSTDLPMVMRRSDETGASSTNNQSGIASAASASTLAAGSTIGGRKFTKADGSSLYGPAATIGLRPKAVSTVKIKSVNENRRIGAQFTSAYLIRTDQPNTYILDGNLTA